MQVIGTDKGFILQFSSDKDLEGNIKNLQGFLEWVRSNPEHQPPFLYMTYDDRIDKGEVDTLLSHIKALYKSSFKDWEEEME
jgi:hypothetical protein